MPMLWIRLNVLLMNTIAELASDSNLAPMKETISHSQVSKLVAGQVLAELVADRYAIHALSNSCIQAKTKSQFYFTIVCLHSRSTCKYQDAQSKLEPLSMKWCMHWASSTNKTVPIVMTSCTSIGRTFVQVKKKTILAELAAIGH